MPPSKEYGFFYACDFTAIVNGGNSQGTIQIEAGADFIVEAILMTANLNVANAIVSRSNLVGVDVAAGNDNTSNYKQIALNTSPKLYRDGTPNAAIATNASLAHLSVKIDQADRSWMNQAIRADLLSGEPGKLFLLPTPILVPGNTALNITIYNKIPASFGSLVAPTVDCQIVLAGRKSRVG